MKIKKYTNILVWVNKKNEKRHPTNKMSLNYHQYCLVVKATA